MRRSSGGAAANSPGAHSGGQRRDHVVQFLRRQRLERRQPLLRRAGAQRADLARREQIAAASAAPARANRPASPCFFSARATSFWIIRRRSGSVGNGSLPVDHRFAPSAASDSCAPVPRSTSSSVSRSSASLRARDSRRCARDGAAGRSTSSARACGPASASPGRGPKVSRFSACWIFCVLGDLPREQRARPRLLLSVRRHTGQEARSTDAPEALFVASLPSVIIKLRSTANGCVKLCNAEKTILVLEAT